MEVDLSRELTAPAKRELELQVEPTTQVQCLCEFSVRVI